MRRFLLHLMDRIGVARDEHAPMTDSILRERIAGNLTRLDSTFARRMGDQWADWTSVPADLRIATAVGFARTGGKPALDSLLERLRTTKEDEERVQMVHGIAAYPDHGGASTNRLALPRSRSDSVALLERPVRHRPERGRAKALLAVAHG